MTNDITRCTRCAIRAKINAQLKAERDASFEAFRERHSGSYWSNTTVENERRNKMKNFFTVANEWVPKGFGMAIGASFFIIIIKLGGILIEVLI